jgi:hypothetical protein
MSPSLVSFTSVDPSILSTGGMFKVMARIVDKVELDRLLDMAEIVMKEDAEYRRLKRRAREVLAIDELTDADAAAIAKAMAPKEEPHTAIGDCDCNQGRSPSTKKAVATSQRKSLDEAPETMGDVAKNREGHPNVFHSDVTYKSSAERMKAGSPAYDPHRTEIKRVDETRMPASVIKHKQRIANMTPEEKAKKFAGKSEEQLKSMARRHGYGKDSNEYSKHGSFEKKEQVDEARMSDRFVANVKKGDDKTMGAIKSAIKGYNKAHGTKHRADVAGRLGKDNPNASKYGDKRKGQLGRSKIRQGDASSSDVYLRPRERDYSKPDFGYKDDNEHTRKIKHGIMNKLKKKHVKEEKGDRLTPGFANRKDFDTIAKEIGTGQGGMTMVSKAPQGGESKQQTIYPMSPKSTSRVAPDDVEKKLDTSTPGNPQAERNRDLKEKLTKGMSAGKVISDFVHSKDPKFKGKSTKERQKMALGAYYGMHPEKSKVNEDQMDEAMGSIKKASAFRTMKRKVSTQVKAGLGVEGESKTIQVTRKNDPSRKVLRIAKDKFDATRYVKV